MNNIKSKSKHDMFSIKILCEVVYDIAVKLMFFMLYALYDENLVFYSDIYDKLYVN